MAEDKKIPAAIKPCLKDPKRDVEGSVCALQSLLVNLCNEVEELKNTVDETQEIQVRPVSDLADIRRKTASIECRLQSLEGHQLVVAGNGKASSHDEPESQKCYSVVRGKCIPEERRFVRGIFLTKAEHKQAVGGGWNFVAKACSTTEEAEDFIEQNKVDVDAENARHCDPDGNFSKEWHIVHTHHPGQLNRPRGVVGIFANPHDATSLADGPGNRSFEKFSSHAELDEWKNLHRI